MYCYEDTTSEDECGYIGEGDGYRLISPHPDVAKPLMSSLSYPEGLSVHDSLWNRRWGELLNRKDSEVKFREVAEVAREFEHAASLYGRIIINERFLPVERKTIKPIDIGGFAGGQKYRCRGILFKFAQDSELRKGVFMYGGSISNDGLASKTAGHELKAVSQIVDAGRSGEEGVHVPLMALIDYRGYRLIAMAVLPIAKETIAYGSCDRGTTVHADVPWFCAKLDAIFTRLNLKSHIVGDKRLSGPGDVEGHCGLDGNLYAVDFARVLPPESVRASRAAFPFRADRAVFYNLLRPEFVATLSSPLCSDAYSGWQRRDPNKLTHNREVDSATEFLFNAVVPQVVEHVERCASRFDARFAIARNRATEGGSTTIECLYSSSATRVEELHTVLMRVLDAFPERGLNMRYLGVVRNRIENAIFRRILFTEMAARVCKVLYRALSRAKMRQLRVAATEPLRRLILDLFNYISNSESRRRFWYDTGGLAWATIGESLEGELEHVLATVLLMQSCTEEESGPSLGHASDSRDSSPFTGAEQTDELICITEASASKPSHSRYPAVPKGTPIEDDLSKLCMKQCIVAKYGTLALSQREWESGSAAKSPNIHTCMIFQGLFFRRFCEMTGITLADAHHTFHDLNGACFPNYPPRYAFVEPHLADVRVCIKRMPFVAYSEGLSLYLRARVMWKNMRRSRNRDEPVYFNILRLMQFARIKLESARAFAPDSVPTLYYLARTEYFLASSRRLSGLDPRSRRLYFAGAYQHFTQVDPLRVPVDRMTLCFQIVFSPDMLESQAHRRLRRSRQRFDSSTTLWWKSLTKALLVLCTWACSRLPKAEGESEEDAQTLSRHAWRVLMEEVVDNLATVDDSWMGRTASIVDDVRISRTFSSKRFSGPKAVGQLLRGYLCIELLRWADYGTSNPPLDRIRHGNLDMKLPSETLLARSSSDYRRLRTLRVPLGKPLSSTKMLDALDDPDIVDLSSSTSSTRQLGAPVYDIEECFDESAGDSTSLSASPSRLDAMRPRSPRPSFLAVPTGNTPGHTNDDDRLVNTDAELTREAATLELGEDFVDELQALGLRWGRHSVRHKSHSCHESEEGVTVRNITFSFLANIVLSNTGKALSLDAGEVDIPDWMSSISNLQNDGCIKDAAACLLGDQLTGSALITVDYLRAYTFRDKATEHLIALRSHSSGLYIGQYEDDLLAVPRNQKKLNPFVQWILRSKGRGLFTIQNRGTRMFLSCKKRVLSKPGGITLTKATEKGASRWRVCSVNSDNLVDIMACRTGKYMHASSAGAVYFQSFPRTFGMFYCRRGPEAHLVSIRSHSGQFLAPEEDRDRAGFLSDSPFYWSTQGFHHLPFQAVLTRRCVCSTDCIAPGPDGSLACSSSERFSDLSNGEGPQRCLACPSSGRFLYISDDGICKLGSFPQSWVIEPCDLERREKLGQLVGVLSGQLGIAFGSILKAGDFLFFTSHSSPS